VFIAHALLDFLLSFASFPGCKIPQEEVAGSTLPFHGRLNQAHWGPRNLGRDEKPEGTMEMQFRLFFFLGSRISGLSEPSATVPGWCFRPACHFSTAGIQDLFISPKAWQSLIASMVLKLRLDIRQM
jgi:hypothetical protein